MKHIARKYSRTREQCVEAHVHTSLELCAVLTQVAVVLLLAHSKFNTRGALTQTSKPQRIKSDLVAVLRLETNRTLEYKEIILEQFLSQQIKYENSPPQAEFF